MKTGQNSIQVRSLVKTYGTVEALTQLNFDIQDSELFGFIGPDGAGKTTLFRILATLLLADQGEVRLNGLDVVKDYRKIRTILGYMPGRFSLYTDLSVEQNLQFYARIFGTDIRTHYHLIRDIYEHLAPFKDRLAGQLSGGMKQKLALCCSLIHKPEILILDEPTTGVDAVSRREFWEMLKRLKNEGITIIVSTPYMDEAALCDRVALIQQGRILSIDTPEGIVKAFPKKLIAVQTDSMYTMLQDLRAFDPDMSINLFGSRAHIAVSPDRSPEAEIEAFLLKKGHGNVKVEAATAGIEDCFMELMANAERNGSGN